MPTRRSFSTAAVPTTLSADITNAAVTLSVADGSTYVDGTSGPSVLTLNRGKSNEERVLYTSRVGNTFSGLTRGYNGTAAQAHTAGEPVEHTSTQQDFDEANAHLADTSRNDHTQYARVGSGNTFTAAQSFSSTIAVTGAATFHSSIGADGTVTALVGDAAQTTVGLIGTAGGGMQVGGGTPTNYMAVIAGNTWGIFTNTAQQVKIDDGGGPAGQTALSIREGAAVQRVLAGAAGTGPGGSGKALYLA